LGQSEPAARLDFDRVEGDCWELVQNLSARVV
jgi:hypothetical protein